MTRPRVALFVTCLVDTFRPQVGFAAVALLRRAGCEVDVPEQTCCGQPAYNAGDAADAKALAQNVIAAFEPYDALVAPSGSCAGMIRTHYPKLLADDAAWAPRAQKLAEKTHELMEFLAARGVDISAACPRDAAYHDSCSSLREMGVAAAPRALLGKVAGLNVKPLAEPEVCCGFGGFFSVKQPDISARMADDKLDDAKRTGATLLMGGDLGCLLHLAGRAARRGDALQIRHTAEILAGESGPAIGKDTP